MEERAAEWWALGTRYYPVPTSGPTRAQNKRRLKVAHGEENAAGDGFAFHPQVL
jgi:hypothetical protein